MKTALSSLTRDNVLPPPFSSLRVNRFASVLAVVVLLICVAGGWWQSRLAPAEATRGKLLVGLSLDTLKEERWQSDRNNFVRRVGELGGEVLVQSASGDDTRQISDVQALISRKVDVLVIVPHNGAAMAKAVNMAHEAGIPVIAYDRLITGCDLDLYVTFDNVKVGRLQARYLVDRMPADRPLRLISIYGSKTDNNALLFKQGQDEVLDPLIAAGRVEVVHADWAADWKPENAKKITNAAITKAAGRGFDAILASADGVAGGAIQALLEEGLAGKVIVTGQDAELAACQRIVNGTQAMSIYKPLKQLADRAAELAVSLARREPIITRDGIDNGRVVVPTVLLDILVAEKENLETTVIRDGMHSRDAIFRRPGT